MDIVAPPSYSPPALLRACPVEKGGPVLPEERPRIHENSVTETTIAQGGVRPSVRACVVIFERATATVGLLVRNALHPTSAALAPSPLTTLLPPPRLHHHHSLASAPAACFALGATTLTIASLGAS